MEEDAMEEDLRYHQWKVNLSVTGSFQLVTKE